MNGVYGTKRPAKITSKDVDIFYFYRPSRNSDDDINFSDGRWKKIDSSILSETQITQTEVGVDDILSGMYNLRLPLDTFNKVGIYDIYIKPKEVYTTIVDVSTLYAYPNIRGIILDISNTDIPYENGELVGYRVEYFDNGKRTDEFRIITSNNKCEPVAQNLVNGYSKGITYRFNDSSSLVFCTLTPSIGMSFKSTSMPYIGTTLQKIALINTKFNPISLEIEMTDKSIEGLATMLEGRQIRNLNKGLITTFDKDGNIYHQAEYGNIANKDTGINHDFKIPNESGAIDTSEKTRLNEIERQI